MMMMMMMVVVVVIMMMTMMMMMSAAPAAAVFFKIQNHHTETDLFEFCSLHNVHKTNDIEAVWEHCCCSIL